MRFLATIAATAVLTFSSAVQASVITANVDLSNQLNAGGAHAQGAFDVNALLAAHGLAGHWIFDATLVASGYSDPQPARTLKSTSEVVNFSKSNTPAPQTKCVGLRCAVVPVPLSVNRDLTQTAVYSDQDTVIDTLQLKAGKRSASGSDAHWTASQTVATGQFTRANSQFGIDTVHTFVTDNFDEYSGALDATLQFSEEFDGLMNHGLFFYDASALAGQLQLRHIMLRLNVNDLPEPVSGALVLAGMGALALSRRRR